MFSKIFLLSILCSQLLLAQAAGYHFRTPHSDAFGCGVDVDHEEIVRMEENYQRMRPGPNLFRANNSAPVEIDVVWNVIAANGTREGGWISTKTIKEQMRVVNQDFEGTGWSFRLTRTQRIFNKRYFSGINITLGFEDPVFNEFTKRFRRGGPETLNIYSLELPLPILGVGTFPALYEELQNLDGILLHHYIVPGGPLPPYDLGRTLTHEIGHWLGLLHTFQGGCEEPGDFVSDTAPQEAETGDCNFRVMCGIPTTPNNFMDYNPDSCQTRFTAGQIQRMQEQTRAFRGIAC
ncbi:hypothetical protein AX16_009190 [Volvariella volvacea WC 439]|nr:hypothetical protein AX16_009190 [Volvariella volvacea WC 439]